jgi:hypothetical protein
VSTPSFLDATSIGRAFPEVTGIGTGLVTTQGDGATGAMWMLRCFARVHGHGERACSFTLHVPISAYVGVFGCLHGNCGSLRQRDGFICAS